jgi:ferredoxin-NADP reductase
VIQPTADCNDGQRLNWQAAKVVDSFAETARVRSIVLDCPGWPGHVPGQHVDIRLISGAGDPTQRSYSIASAPEDEHLVLSVERLWDGELSPYLVDELRPGDSLELRGPIGEYFIWNESFGGPLLLLAGGSGIVPLRAMLRHRVAARSAVATRLLYSSRSFREVIYRDELARLAAYDEVDVLFTLTREWPDGWRGHRRRIDGALLREISWAPRERPLMYVCGPTAFVDAAATTLVQLGHDPEGIKTERFGPTGG